MALVVFSVLGIFSLSYRKLAKEAFDCVFRRITFRPCQTGFDQKMKAKIIGRLLKKHFRLAKLTSRYFEVISWIFVILFFASMIFSAKSAYNLIRYKNCSPQHPESCILSPRQQEKCQCQDGKVFCNESEKDSCKGGECDQCEGCQQ